MKLLLLAFFALSAPCWACACAGNWPSVKQAWQSSPFVFLGTVELATPDDDALQVMFQNQTVRIRVDEAFKNVFPGEIIQLHQGADDCSGKFRTGQRFVFYLSAGTKAERWILPWCYHSLGSADPGGDDLLFLTKLPQSAKGTRFSGEVEFYEDSRQESFRRVGGVAGVHVKITGPNGSITDAVTNNDGAYEVYGLPPGRYSASIVPPSGMKITFPVTTGSLPIMGNDTSVELGRNGGVSVGFVLKADTQLSGHMLDAQGNPKKDVCIDLEPLLPSGENGAAFFDCSKNNGSFTMKMMPPGQYRLIARDEQNVDGFKSKSTLYYPGARLRSQSQIITVEAGKYLHNLDIKIPAVDKRVRIAGRILFDDGVPLRGSRVSFNSALDGYTETTETAGDGSFALLIVDGIDGELRARKAILSSQLRSCPQIIVEPIIRGLFRFMSTIPMPLSGGSNHENVQLTLPFSSCKAWP